MKNEHAPETPAIRFLKAHKIPFSTHLYDYEEHGGTKVSARELNVDEHAVIKTLVFENESAKPFVVLMHGDCKVSAKELARQIGCKRTEPCKPEAANRHTGYLVGGTSPFGTKKAMPVYIEKSFRFVPDLHQRRPARFFGRHSSARLARARANDRGSLARRLGRSPGSRMPSAAGRKFSPHWA